MASTSFKILLNGEIRRLTVNNNNTETWTTFNQKIAQVLSLTPGAFSVKYTDEDGDLITISSDLELAEVIRANNTRLQIFPGVPAASTPAPAPAAAPVTISPAQEPVAASEEDEEDEEDEDGEGESDSDDDEEEDDGQESTASSEDKGKEKVDESKSEGDDQQQQQQQQQQQPQPTLQEIFERVAGVRDLIQGIFEQHPEIQQELDTIGELFTAYHENKVKEFQRRQEEAKRRWEEHQQRLREQQQRAQEAFFCRRGFCGPQPTARSCQGGGFRGGCGQQQQKQQQQPFARIAEQKLAALESMGFVDRDLNFHLLRKHFGDLEGVVQELAEINEQF